MSRRESETTEYDCSTDDESLRFLMSETDQVYHDDDDGDDDNDDDDDDDDNDDYDDDDELTATFPPVSRVLGSLQPAKQLWQPTQLACKVQISKYCIKGIFEHSFNVDHLSVM